MVTEPTVLVIAGVIPIDLLFQQRKTVDDSRDVAGRRAAKKEARELTVCQWQERGENETRRRWAARCNITEWMGQSKLNYYLTSLFAGPLNKMRKVENLTCPYQYSE